jgi:hypothetical protein
MRNVRRALTAIGIAAVTMAAILVFVPDFSSTVMVEASDFIDDDDDDFDDIDDFDDDLDDESDDIEEDIYIIDDDIDDGMDDGMDEDQDDDVIVQTGDLAEDTSQQKKGLARISISLQECYQAAFEVLELLNEERAKVGASPLTMDTELLKSAMVRSAELSVFYSHKRPDNTDCSTANGKMDGENIAAGQKTAQSVMAAWMNSSEDKANILNTSFQSVGIGCVIVDSNYYWAQCFSWDAGTGAVVSDYADRTMDRTVYVTQTMLKKQLSVKTQQTTVVAGSTAQLVVTWKDNTFSKKTVISNGAGLAGTSSKPDVCTLSDGKIIAKNVGRAVLTVYYPDCPKIKFKLTVKVRARYPKDTTPIYLKVHSTGKKLKISVGQTVTLKIKGMKKSNYFVTVKCGDEISVEETEDSTILLTGKKAGTTEFVYKDKKGKITKAAVTVQEKKVKTQKITGLAKKITLKVGETKQLNPKISPATSQQKITFSSANSKIAAVDDGGTITAKRAGTAKITVKSGSEKFVVTVKVKK